MNMIARSSLLLGLIFAAGSALAICPIFPIHYRVGATPPYCTHNDIQSAIDAVGSCATVIDVTREHTYTDQHLAISGKNVTLQGWGDGVSCYDLATSICPDCGPGSTNPLVTLDGGDNGRVLTITDSNVGLSNLTVSGGNANGGDGGGIYFGGAGNLSLAATTVSFNTAGYGAGIDVAGGGAGATLTLYANSLILSNTAAHSGGGIRIEGAAQLVATQPSTLIAFNAAQDAYGGGVEILGPARADIGSPGYGGLGVIYDNNADSGGGLAVLAGTDGDETEQGIANLYTTDPSAPVTIQGNFAAYQGGAIYAKGYVQFVPAAYNVAVACLSNARVVDNSAPDGAIAFLDWDEDIAGEAVGSRLFVNTAICGGSGGVACDPGGDCNQVYGNVSEDGLGQPTDGRLIFVGRSSTFRADKLDLRGSKGRQLVYVFGNNFGNYSADGLLRNCLLADNVVSQELIYDGADNLALDSCTIAGNTIGSAYVGDMHSLTNALIYQPGLKVSGVAEANYVLVNDKTGIPGSTVQLVQDPKFVDAANGDYHLQLTSPAIDFGGGEGGTDVEGFARDIDLAARANTYGPRDAGAYERQSAFACDASSDAIYCATFDP